MSEEADHSKSEQATAYKLSKAREKGAVARGTDLAFLTGLASCVGYLWMVGGDWIGRLEQASAHAFILAPSIVSGADAILALTGAVLGVGAHVLAWMAAVVFGVVLAFEVLQTGPVFTTETLKPDFNRLNPAQNVKRMFSTRLLIHAGKSLLKVAAYITITVLTVRHAFTARFAAITDARSLAAAMADMGLRLLLAFIAAAAVFAALDQLLSRAEFGKRMRMSRREVRRELRDREGEPRVKQRRRQLHRQFVRLSQSFRNIRGADVLLVNPTHVAVALRYDHRTMTAPQIVSQASNLYALRLKRLAFVYGVAIVHRPALARGLYQKGELNKTIPEAFYRAVAEVYLELRARRLAIREAQGV